MPGLDERIRQGLESLAELRGRPDAFERVTFRKSRRRTIRKVQVTALSFIVVAGTSVGAYGLLRAFRPSYTRVAGPLPANGKIAFVRTLDPTEGDPFPYTNIRLLDSSSGRMTQIWAGSGEVSTLSWSPAGTQLVFDLLSETGLSIYRVRADGTGLKRLSGGSTPAWSPDGRSIAFVLGRSHRPPAIYLMRPDGRGLRPVHVLDPTAQIKGLSWTPDGQRILFARSQNVGTQTDIFSIGIDGGQQAQLTNDARPLGQPSMSPDGTMIVFSGFRASGGGSGRGRGEIFTMNADGSRIRALTQDDAIEGGPAWSPDGTKIIYWRQGFEEGKTSLWVMNPDGSEQHRIFEGPATLPAWQPVPAGPRLPTTRPTASLEPPPRATGAEILATLPGSVTKLAGSTDSVYAAFVADRSDTQEKLVRIDLATGDLIEGPSFSRVAGIVAAGRWLWVVASKSSVQPVLVLFRLDVETLENVGTVDITPSSGGMVEGFGGIWITTPSGITFVDSLTARVLREVSLPAEPGPIDLDSFTNTLYVAIHEAGGQTPLRIQERDGTTGKLLVDAPGSPGLAVNNVSASPGGVWISVATGMLGYAAFLRSSDLHQTAEFKGPKPGPGSNAIAAYYTGGSGHGAVRRLWVLDGGAVAVVCADPDTGRAQSTIDLHELSGVEGGFSNLAVGEGYEVFMGHGPEVLTLTCPE